MSSELQRSPIRGLLITFSSIALLILASVAVIFYMGRVVISAQETIVSRQGAVESLQDTLTTLVDAETGQRGYLLIGEDVYLGPYNAAITRFNADLKRLQAFESSKIIDSASFAEINRLSSLKLSELKRTIDERRAAGFQSAVTIVRDDTGRQLMESLRSLFTNLIKQQDGDLAILHHQVTEATKLRNVVFILTAAINVIFLVWAFGRTRREMELSARTLQALTEQKDLLSVTLRSIGDGVIVTDLQGRVTFMNSVAETLTGYNNADAVGKLCQDVFHIINETSRQRVESPVDKVLRLGTIVGLANHTLLIRKDSTEIPIDDSGAPISHPDGGIRGVVLVFRDFTDYKSAEKKLLQAKEEAEAANVAKDNFLATLSHELRTPLTPVLASLSLWSQSKALAPALLNDIQMMRRNLELEARLIDDLLDLTRIVRGKLSLNMEVTDLHSLLSAVTEMYRSEIQGKHLRLVMDLAAPQHFVRSDVGRMQQVFWNILKNATKFTPEHGEIRIQTSNDYSGHAQVMISDNGIGIPPETLEHLFQPFQQGADEIVKRYGGLGLGLAISKTLVEAQGGAIQASSAGKNKGATFTISLTLADAPGDATGAPSDESGQIAAPAAALKILLVEDHVDTARVMSRLLQGLGHTVRTEGTVATALQTIQSENFDVMISDIGLPDGTGLDLISQIRRKLKLTLPAIALTGYGMEEDIRRCIDAGFNQHLTKPINFYNLELMVRKLTAEKVS